MTDKEIIKGLIDRDNAITQQFLYVRCRPLLTSVMRRVFGYPVEYDEMVSELYAYLMADDAAKLHKFEYRSTLFQWLKVVALRFFIHNRDSLIEDATKEPLYEKNDDEVYVDTASEVACAIDTEKLLSMMTNRRYVEVIRHLILLDEDPTEYAESIGVSVDNLYNIKRRAIASLTRIAVKYYTPAYGHTSY